MSASHAAAQPNSTGSANASTEPEAAQSIDDLPPYANAQQVAAFLGQSIATVRYWVTTGYIPSIRLGRTRRFPRESLRAWLAEQEQVEATR